MNRKFDLKYKSPLVNSVPLVCTPNHAFDRFRSDKKKTSRNCLGSVKVTTCQYQIKKEREKKCPSELGNKANGLCTEKQGTKQTKGWLRDEYQPHSTLFDRFSKKKKKT